MGSLMGGKNERNDFFPFVNGSKSQIERRNSVWRDERLYRDRTSSHTRLSAVSDMHAIRMQRLSTDGNADERPIRQECSTALASFRLLYCFVCS
jgi:hypothetical protein